MIRFACKKCGEFLEAPSSMIGDSLECPKCTTKACVPKSPQSKTLHIDNILIPSTYCILISTIVLMIWLLNVDSIPFLIKALFVIILFFAVIFFFLLVSNELTAPAGDAARRDREHKLSKAKEQQEILKSKIESMLKVNNFTPIHAYFKPIHAYFDLISATSRYALQKTGVFVSKDKVLFLRVENNEIISEFYAFNKLLGVELDINYSHSTTTKGATSKEGPAKIGRSLVGGIIAGPTGAVIGGLSGKRKGTINTNSNTHKKVESIFLLVTVSDINTPHYKIQFNNLDTAKKWKSILDAAKSI